MSMMVLRDVVAQFIVRANVVARFIACAVSKENQAMSQQMFEPQQSQQNQSQGQQEQREQQGWWAYDRPGRDKKMREMPKNEHPSTFEEPFATTNPVSGEVQDTVENTIESNAGEKIHYQSGYTGYASNASDTGRYSSDSDRMEYGYRPYDAYQPSQTATYAGVPPWARPQRNPVFRILAKVLVILMIAGLVLKVIIPLLVVLFAFAAIVSIVIVIALLVFGVFILGILRLLGIRIPLRPARFRGRRGRWRHMYFDL